MRETYQTYGKKMTGLALIVTLLGSVGGAIAAQQNQKASILPGTKEINNDVPSSKVEESNDRPALQQRNPRYQLSQGDIFDLAFPFTPEFNQSVTVHPDGFITLTGLSDLYVLGKTAPELREILKTAYAKILHDPVINVVLKDVEKPYFIAGGQIGRPGKYDLRGDTTLTEAIAIAGGFNENSKHSQVLLFRRVSNEWAEVKVINVKKMLQGESLSEDLHLHPGDMFFVPQNRISKIRKYLPIPSTGMSLDPTRF